MRWGDIKMPKPQHWGVLATVNRMKDGGGGGCHREEGGAVQRGRWLGEGECSHGAPCWPHPDKKRSLSH